MIEKPKEGQEFSNLSILGRVLLSPDIFDILENLAPGAGGEIQLTDAMAEYARLHGVTALEFEGTRYDMGSKLGFMMANVARACEHPEIGEDFLTAAKAFDASVYGAKAFGFGRGIVHCDEASAGKNNSFYFEHG
jgi:UTP--glucose-1-phosphate uridylyltransferase